MVTDGWFSRFTILNPRLKTQNSSGPRSGAKPDNSLLGYLKEIGCAFQGNLGSFAGRYGGRVRQAAERLREAGIYTHFGSDAHGVEHIRDLGLPASVP
jgi:protein-tyrosine phosphatase